MIESAAIKEGARVSEHRIRVPPYISEKLREARPDVFSAGTARGVLLLACEGAGIALPRQPKRTVKPHKRIPVSANRISKAAAFNDIKRVAKEMGRQPTQDEYDRLGSFDHKTVTKWHGSWSKTVEACGLVYKRRRPFSFLKNPGKGKPVDTADLIRDLRRIEADLGYPPSVSDYERHGKHSKNSLYHHANTNHWDEVLTHFLGLSPDEAKRRMGIGGRGKTPEEKFNLLRALAKRLKRSPTSREASLHGVSHTQLLKRFGTWNGVLKAAGLHERRRPRRVPRTSRTPRTQQQLPPVHDPVRDFVKTASLDAIQAFFKRKGGMAQKCEANDLEQGAEPATIS